VNNPFRDAPENLCRRVLEIWDELTDDEIGQLYFGIALDEAFVNMLELRVYMSRESPIWKNQVTWNLPPGSLVKGGQVVPFVNLSELKITVAQPEKRTFPRFGRKPTG